MALECLPWLEAEAKERQKEHGDTAPGRSKTLTAKLPEVKKGEAREQAGQMVGVGARYVSDAKRIKEQAPEVFEQVQKGELTLQQAKQISSLSEEKQGEAITEVLIQKDGNYEKNVNIK